jgi:hypothetical protein
MMKRRIFALAGLLAISTAALAQDYGGVSADDRMTYVASNNQKGNTVSVPTADITRLCGDMDGCQARIGMYNWDGTGRVASREFLFYYNPQNRAWRVSAGDLAGTDANTIVEHVNNSWTCYMTDGEYLNSAGTDAKQGFGLLVRTQYNADCWLTLID